MYPIFPDTFIIGYFCCPYIFGHKKTCPVFLIKLPFFTTGIFCLFALFTCVSGQLDKPLGPVYTPNKIYCGVWHYEPHREKNGCR